MPRKFNAKHKAHGSAQHSAQAHGLHAAGETRGYGGSHIAHMQTAADYARDASAYRNAINRVSGRKKKLAIAASIAGAVILALIIAVIVYLAFIGDQLNRGDKSDDELSAIDEALGGYKSNFDEPFYMLLIGSDARPGETFSRSDTNIVARVDPIKEQLTLLSIPRDTKIEIDGHGTQKFNAAYAFGKVPGVIHETEELLDIEISHYAEVSFLELKGLVDAVGGVTVDVEARIDDPHCDDGDGNHYVIEKGTQTLAGGEALTFARSRHYANGDFTRTSNQRKLIEAIINKVLSSPVSSIPGIVSAGAKCVTTDLKLMDIIGLAQQFANNGDIVMYNAMLPSYTQNINGISFVINDEEKTAEMMDLFKAGLDPSGIESAKTASDITTSKVDTSNTLLTENDDEVVSGGAHVNIPSGAGNSSGTGTNTGGTSGGTPGGSTGGGGGTPGGDTPSGGTPGGGSGSGGDASSGGSGPGNEGSGSSDAPDGGSGGSAPSGGGSGNPDTAD